MDVSTPEDSAGLAPAFRQTMTWRAAFSLAASLPASALAVIGYWTGALGGWTAMTLLAVSSILALLQNFLYAEMASAYPQDAGGIAAYANRAWRDRCSPVGAVAAGGYWVGWLFGLAANALVIGSLVQAQWFPEQTGTFSLGSVDLGLGHLIAIVSLVAVWLLNLFGIEPAVRVSQTVNVLVIAVMAAVAVLTLARGEIDPGRLTWGLDASGTSPFLVGCVWLFLMGWTVYGTEIAATFTPEYRDPSRDAPKALLFASILSLGVFVAMPFVAAAAVGEDVIAADPLGFNVVLFEQAFGSAGGLAIAVVCLAMLNLMSVSTADSGRALYAMAGSRLTLKSLGSLNPAGVPGRAMTLGLALNIGVVLFIGDLLGIIFASNLGYFFAVVSAISGYLLLRRHLPGDRAVKLSGHWVPIAGVLLVVNLTLLAVATTHPSLTGYGGFKELFIGFGVLGLVLASFYYRRISDRWSKPGA